MKTYKQLVEATKPIYDYWNKILTDDLIFKVSDDTKHTYNHSRRVLKFALMIGFAEGLTEKQLHALGAACIFHDCGRINALDDKEHGARGAEIYNIYWHTHDIKYSNTTYLAIYYHNLSDYEGIEAFEKHRLANDICVLKVLKDADALDRFRFGADNLDKRMLRTHSAKSESMIAYAAIINNYDLAHGYY